MNGRSSPLEPRDPLSTPGSNPRVRYRGAFRISIGISAVLHVLAVALYPNLFSAIPQVTFAPGGRIQPPAIQGTELINLQEIPADQEPEMAPPEEEPEPVIPVTPVPSRPTGVVPAPGPEAEVDPSAYPTAAERIRPKAGDLRLWAPIDPDLTRLSDEEILRLRLIAELEAMGDSAALAEELARPDTDWTHTDGQGRKWGVSPGKIHLGDLTLPFPFAFGTAPANRERVEGRIWEWEQIQRGAQRGDIMRSWKDRDEAMRARRNAERRPDTTGIRR